MGYVHVEITGSVSKADSFLKGLVPRTILFTHMSFQGTQDLSAWFLSMRTKKSFSDNLLIQLVGEEM